MSKDLFFIPLIVRAMSQSDPASALRGIFAEIQLQGQLPEYRRGYSQFLRFIEIVALHAEQEDSFSGTPWSVRNLMIDLAGEGFEGTGEERQKALDWLASNATWAEQFQLLQDDFAEIDTLPTGPRFHVLSKDRDLGTIEISEETGKGSLGGIAPGEYSILLETGRLLWQGCLTRRQLTWSIAFPNQPLRLAAATGDSGQKPTHEEPLVDDDWVLRVFAGTETGRLEIARSSAGI